MTTTSRARLDPRARRRGFTLSEVIIASTLTVVAMSGILSTALMINRSAYRVNQYTDMESESRKTLEIFGQDVRMAQSVTWNSANSLTLTIPTTAAGNDVRTCTYTYNSANKTFSRVSGGVTTVLLTEITDCSLMGYKTNGDVTHTSDNPAAGWVVVSNSTKQLQLSVSTARNRTNLVNTTQKVISARFILRNKRVA